MLASFLMGGRKTGFPLRGNTLQAATGNTLQGATSPQAAGGTMQVGLQGGNNPQTAGTSLQATLTRSSEGLGDTENTQNNFPSSFANSPSSEEKIFHLRQLQVNREASSAWDSSSSGAAHSHRTAPSSLRGPQQLHTPSLQSQRYPASNGEFHTALVKDSHATSVEDSHTAYNGDASEASEAALQNPADPSTQLHKTSHYNVPSKLLQTRHSEGKLPGDYQGSYREDTFNYRKDIQASWTGDTHPGASYKKDSEPSLSGNNLHGLNGNTLQTDHPSLHERFSGNTSDGQSQDYLSSYKRVQLTHDNTTYHREYLSSIASDTTGNNTSIPSDLVTHPLRNGTSPAFYPRNNTSLATHSLRNNSSIAFDSVTDPVGNYRSIESDVQGHTDGFQEDLSSIKGKVFNGNDFESPLQDINKRPSLRHLLSEADWGNSKATHSGFDQRGKEFSDPLEGKGYLNQSQLVNAQNTSLINNTERNTSGDFVLNQSSLRELNTTKSLQSEYNNVENLDTSYWSKSLQPGSYKDYITAHDVDNTQGLSHGLDARVSDRHPVLSNLHANPRDFHANSTGLTDIHNGVHNDLSVSNVNHGLYNKGLSYRTSGDPSGLGFQSQSGSSHESAASSGDSKALYNVESSPADYKHASSLINYNQETSRTNYNQEASQTNYNPHSSQQLSDLNQESSLTNYTEYGSQELITESYIDTHHTGITKDYTHTQQHAGISHALNEWSYNSTQSQVPDIFKDNFTTTSPQYNYSTTTHGYNATFPLDTNGANKDYSEGITHNPLTNVLSDLSTQFDLGNVSTEFPGYISPTNISFDLDIPLEFDHMLSSNLTSIHCTGENESLSSLCYSMGTAFNTTANASLGEDLELAPDPRWWALFLILFPIFTVSWIFCILF